MRIAWTLFKYLLAVGLLAWVVTANWDPPAGNGLKHVYERHFVQGEPFGYGYFLLAILFTALAVSVSFFRWYLLVRALDLPFTLFSAFRLGMVGFFFNTFLPGSVGGDIVKAAGIARQQSRRAAAVSTVIMDRVIALWGLLWLVVAACLLCRTFGWVSDAAQGVVGRIFQVSSILLAVSVVVWVGLGFLPTRRAEIFRGRLEWWPKVGKALGELWWAVWVYRKRPATVLAAISLAWFSQVCYCLVIYCTASTIWDGKDHLPTLGEHFLIVPIGLTIEALPLFPGGAGIGEAGFGGLYHLFGSVAAIGVLAALLRRMIHWGLGLVGYLVYLQMKADVPEPDAPVAPATPEPQLASNG